MIRYVIFMILLSSFVVGDTITENLFLGDSVEFLGKNITLVSTGEDKIVICVNNERKIVDNKRIVNEVDVDVRKIEDNFAKIKFRYTCNEDCVCTDDCGNERCIFNADEGVSGRGITFVEPGCVSSAECGDGDSCTTDLCVQSVCQNFLIDNCGVEDRSYAFPLISVGLFGILLILVIIYIVKR